MTVCIGDQEMVFMCCWETSSKSELLRYLIVWPGWTVALLLPDAGCLSLLCAIIMLPTRWSGLTWCEEVWEEPCTAPLLSRPLLAVFQVEALRSKPQKHGITQTQLLYKAAFWDAFDRPLEDPVVKSVYCSCRRPKFDLAPTLDNW